MATVLAEVAHCQGVTGVLAGFMAEVAHCLWLELWYELHMAGAWAGAGVADSWRLEGPPLLYTWGCSMGREARLATHSGNNELRFSLNFSCIQ